MFVFSVMWSELQTTSAISCPLWSSVYEFQRVECAYTSPVRTECGMFVMYCMQCCMSVSAVLYYVDVLSQGGIQMFAIMICLKFCVVCIDGRRYVCCSECNVVSNECNEPTSCIVQPVGTHGGDVMYFGCVCFTGQVGFLNCDDICKCVVNKQFELLQFVFDSVYVDLQYDERSLTFTAGSVSLCCVCGHVVVFGLSVRLSWLL